MFKRKLFLSLSAVAMMIGIHAASFAQDNKEVKFTVRIENISNADGQVAKDGTKWPFALSPGLWVVHEREVRLYREGVVPNGGRDEQPRRTGQEPRRPRTQLNATRSLQHSGWRERPRSDWSRRRL